MELKDIRHPMEKALFTSPYPPMVLSTKQKDELRKLARDLVQVNVEGYEEFLFDHKGKLPVTEWQFTRRDEQVETFLRRREKYSLEGFGATRRIRASDENSSSSSSNSEQLSSLDVVDIRSIGSTDGTLEDAIYGAMGPTTETMRYKSVYVKDGIEDCNVLAIIDNVSTGEPFSTLTIRWRVTENPPVLRSLLKSYDHVYLDATGFTQLSNGERVGFHLLHSVDFSSATPPLPHFSRGQVAAIGFWRQASPRVVEIHGHGVFALPFERARSLFVPVITASMSKSVMHVFHASHMKKLRWALHQRQKSGRPMANTSDSCSVCEKKRVLHRTDRCELCGEAVCSVCCITHKVASVEAANKMRWTKVRVCPFCMTKVTNANAADTIRGEIEAGWYERFP